MSLLKSLKYVDSAWLSSELFHFNDERFLFSHVLSIFLRFCGFCCHFWCKAESLRFEANLSHDSESMALVVGPRWQQRGRMGRIRSGGKAPELSWRLARRLALLWSGEDDVIVESVNIWCLYIMWYYVMLCVLFFRNWKVWNLNSQRCNESVEDISGSISFGSSLEPEKTRFHVFFLIRNGGSTKANWTPRPLPSPEPNRKRDGRSPENGWDDLTTTWWLDDSTREMAFNSEIDEELWHDMMSLVNSLWSPCELWVLTILTILTILTDLRLSAFKSWADAEFGGVRAAFTVLDEDNSHDFNVREFIKMLRFYGFQGDCRALFSTLDCDGHGTLSLNEISFLDLWESPPPTPNRSKENFASRMSQMLPTKNTESETQTKKEEKMKKLPQVSPRLEELARSRHPRAPHRLPLLANASKSTLDSSVAFSSASKSRLQKSVYGSFSRTDGFLEEINKTAWKNFRVKVIKEEILSGHINEDFDFTPLDATFSKVKKKTIALRLRTIELLDKDNQDLRNCLNHSNSVDSLDP